MNIYGIYSIYGCVLVVVIGLKVVCFDVIVFVIIGDGDGLSIGGNYLMYVVCCNLDINIILFNN